jgi:hypothetical protein
LFSLSVSYSQWHVLTDVAADIKSRYKKCNKIGTKFRKKDKQMMDRLFFTQFFSQAPR